MNFNKGVKAVAALGLLAASSFSMAANDMGAGIAYDMGGLGFTGQYKNMSLFVSNGVAFDVRVANFYNNRKTVNFYVDAGGFAKFNGGSAGLRVPLGVSTYVAENIQVYGQFVPNLDFEKDSAFDLDFAGGVRFRF